MRLEDFADETCAYCGKGYDAKRVDQKYCSPACGRKSASRFKTEVAAEERRRARAGRVCRQCAKPFDANRRDQVYCCVRCRRAASHDRHRGGSLKADLASLKCVDCGTPIKAPRTSHWRRCDPCRRAEHAQYHRWMRHYQAMRRSI